MYRPRPSVSTLLAPTLALALSGCVHSAMHDEEHPVAHAAEHAHWDYEGHGGPAAWGELDATYQACAAGRTQSPIDLSPTRAAVTQVPACAFHYGATTATTVNNGHTIQENLAPGDYVELEGTRYDLAQFHFHSPSEHTVDGRHFPLEIHLVHKSAAGKLLVMGVLVEEGAHNPALHQLFEKLPREGEAPAGPFDPLTLLPADRHVITYAGSLTTPPCTEGVTWRVFTTPVSGDKEELDRFRALYSHNNRPVMPVNGRAVLADAP